MTVWMVVTAYYAIITLVTFVAFGLDKWKAKRNAWRTAEVSLHALSLFGGAVGAIFGRAFFRHKTKKGRFAVVAWIAIAFHVGAWIALLVLLNRG